MAASATHGELRSLRRHWSRSTVSMLVPRIPSSSATTSPFDSRELPVTVIRLIVSASAGLTNAELESVEPYDLKQMRRYTPALVSGWIAEEFARKPDECQKSSHGEAVEQIGGKLASAPNRGCTRRNRYDFLLGN